MTLKELKERVKCHRVGYGTIYVTITYRGGEYHCYSHNTLAYDRLNDDDYSDRQYNLSGSGYTNKGAYEALYDECKRKNHLGQYNY